MLGLLLAPPLAGAAFAKEGSSSAVYSRALNYFRELPADNNILTSQKAFVSLQNNEDVFILDVRRPDDYKKGHLKEAANLSFFDMSIPENIEKLPDDKPIFVYCYTGQTASQVTALLNIAGKTAKNIQSGFNLGIIKTDGYDSWQELKEHALPEPTFAVKPEMKKTLTDYFADKMAMDGTLFANFNVSPKTVKAIVDEKNDDYHIVSICRADDYVKGHIPFSQNIPFGLGMEAELVKLPVDKKIIVYCYDGQSSSQTMAVLRLMGYEAYSMSGGMAAWTKANYEVVPQ